MKNTKMQRVIPIVGSIVVVGCAFLLVGWYIRDLRKNVAMQREIIFDLRQSVNDLQQQEARNQKDIPSLTNKFSAENLRSLYFSGQLVESENIYPPEYVNAQNQNNPPKYKDRFLRYLSTSSSASTKLVGILVGGQWSKGMLGGVNFFPYHFSDEQEDGLGQPSLLGITGTSTAVFSIPGTGGDPGGSSFTRVGFNLVTGRTELLVRRGFSSPDFGHVPEGEGRIINDLSWGTEEAWKDFGNHSDFREGEPYYTSTRRDFYGLSFLTAPSVTGSKMYITTVTSHVGGKKRELLKLTNRTNRSLVINDAGVFKNPASVSIMMDGKSYTFLAKDGKITLIK
jgi:uncharacterized coiled-coil protein SlyX